MHRATSRIGEHCYSLTGNNCEHFANWCATGVAISHQVIEFFRMLAAIAKAALTAAAVALALSATRTALAE